VWTNNIFDLENFKIPSISGAIGFILIFFINIIVGNTFFVVITRSLLYGGIVFAVFFALVFLFRNFLSDAALDKDTVETKDKKNEGVDITVSDEEFDEKITEKLDEEIDLNLDNDLAKEDGDFTLNENIVEEKSEVADPILQENAINKNEKVVDDSDDGSYSIEKIKDHEEKEDSEETQFSALSINEGNKIKNEENSSEIIDDNKEIDDIYFSLGNESSKGSKSTDKDIDVEKSIKSKIGQNVSFEEVAKAIRTKMKDE
jgi:hypothetical protein